MTKSAADPTKAPSDRVIKQQAEFLKTAEDPFVTGKKISTGASVTIDANAAAIFKAINEQATNLSLAARRFESNLEKLMPYALALDALRIAEAKKKNAASQDPQVRTTRIPWMRLGKDQDDLNQAAAMKKFIQAAQGKGSPLGDKFKEDLASAIKAAKDVEAMTAEVDHGMVIKDVLDLAEDLKVLAEKTKDSVGKALGLETHAASIYEKRLARYEEKRAQGKTAHIIQGNIQDAETQAFLDRQQSLSQQRTTMGLPTNTVKTQGQATAAQVSMFHDLRNPNKNAENVDAIMKNLDRGMAESRMDDNQPKKYAAKRMNAAADLRSYSLNEQEQRVQQ